MNSTSLLLVVALLFALVALVAVIVLRSRSRPAPGKASSARPAPPAAPAAAAQPETTESAGQAWAPPRYADTRTAAAGPSFSVGISVARLKNAALLVLWNGVNEGSVPVAVHWGSPHVQSAGSNALVLRYSTDASDAAAFVPPETRTVEPGEIVSRSAGVTLPPFDSEAGSLRVTIAVGYGPADGLAAASENADAYAAWQQTAISAPRSVTTR